VKIWHLISTVALLVTHQGFSSVNYHQHSDYQFTKLRRMQPWDCTRYV